MQKKYIVRLTDEERRVLPGVVKEFKGSSEEVRRARVLLKADADGPNRRSLTRWFDASSSATRPSMAVGSTSPKTNWVL